MHGFSGDAEAENECLRRLPQPPGCDSSNPNSGPRTVYLAITLMPSGFASDKYNPISVWASHDMPTEFNVQMFPVIPDFVVTDFKVQGTTEEYLISCLRQRKHLPNFTVQSFNVQFSRVTKGKNFYALGLDKGDMDHLRGLRHNPALIIWEQSYDASGHWNATLALAAANNLLADLQQEAKLKKRSKRANYKKPAKNARASFTKAAKTGSYQVFNF